MPKGDMQADTKTLLTVLMLGITTSWHNSSDLGQRHLQIATRLFQRRTFEANISVVDLREQRQNQFFEQCILYWEMLSALMSDGPLQLTDRRTETNSLETFFELHFDLSASDFLPFPHPWTGVTPNVICLFARTGQLIRQARKSHITYSQVHPLMDFRLDAEAQFTTAFEQACNKAKGLEEELLAFSSPPIDDLIDTGDLRTPLDHFLQIKECYRLASLLLIYRNFPEILGRRLALTEASNNSETLSFSPFDINSGSIPRESPGENWITSLAIRILRALENLPTSSGTRFSQKIIILATAGELKFPTANAAATRLPSSCLHNNSWDLDSDQIDIAWARRFVTLRLQELQLALPTKPVENVQAIIKETWKGLDAGRDVFWLDIMMENQWETIAG
jgi:hypothetical protein